MTELPAAEDPTPGVHRRQQRRVVTTLSVAQLLSGIGNGSGLALGSLMAVELTDSNAFAGAPTMAISVAGALTALPLAGMAIRRGRRIALSTGLMIAALGAVGMALTPVVGSLGLLLVSAALLGVGNAANLQARFAATDLAAPASRARDLGLVVWAITIGAVAGPNLIGPGAALGARLGLPEMSGPFLFSLTGMLLSVVVLTIGLRPDPLSLVRTEPTADRTEAAAPSAIRGGMAILRANPAARLGVLTITGSHLVMVAVMSMTPVHLKDLDALASGGAGAQMAGHHPSLDVLVLIGFTISLHIAGMYALSPLVGLLADRRGRITTMLIGDAVLVAALLTAGLGASHTLAVTTGLVLLGIGWSLATISGSAFVAESVAAGHRVPIQGLSDALMGVAGAVGAAGSGVVLALIGFRGLGLACLVVVVLVAVAAVRQARRTATSTHEATTGVPVRGADVPD
ncbi:MFS transporter [Arthrobacter rhombi]|uniref:MFS transporter n=1 Tax=Arthrobacter rhombi TaxID=71253 RepID=UPI0031DAE828